jgi:hypothetical protein
MLSYYTVNNKIFQNKIEAILYANEKKLDISWHFNQEHYSMLDWSHEPTMGLMDLYKARALEIREKFDYVVLLLSGGADSTNVFNSFVKNNIKIDEVIGTSPLSGLNNYCFNNTDYSSSNIISETIYSQIPLLDRISTNYPNIKVTFLDYFNSMLNYQEDQWVLNSTDWLHPTGTAKFNLEELTHIKNIAESGKRIAIVYGIDKPLIFIKDKTIFSAFTDITVNTIKQPFKTNYPTVENVLFYWAENMPEIPLKQSHVVARWFFNSANRHLLPLVRGVANMPNRRAERERQSRYERIIVPLIYPQSDIPPFQTFKPVSFIMSEIDDWFFSRYKDYRSYQMMISEKNSFVEKLNSKYLESDFSYKYFHNVYELGSIENF